jgi:hypothetical protein
MGDNVWFTTRQGAGGGQSSKFMGFPIPIPIVTQGDIDGFPPFYSAIDHKLAVDLVWRVRRMKLSVDIDIDFKVTSAEDWQVNRRLSGEIVFPWGGYVLYNDEDDGSTVEEISATRERHIMVVEDEFSDGGYGGTASMEWFRRDSNGDIIADFPNEVEGYFLIYEKNLITSAETSIEAINHGWFEMTGQKTNDFYAFWDVGKIWFRISNFPASTRTLAGQYELWPGHPSGGLSANFYATIPNNQTINIKTAIITATPDEYWPYAVQETLPDGSPHPNAELPIYDTDTGAIIYDPVTGFEP